MDEEERRLREFYKQWMIDNKELIDAAIEAKAKEVVRDCIESNIKTGIRLIFKKIERMPEVENISGKTLITLLKKLRILD